VEGQVERADRAVVAVRDDVDRDPGLGERRGDPGWADDDGIGVAREDAGGVPV
jgi:hypothetical protein